MAQPMLGDVELQLVQKIDTSDQQVRTQHSVPSLEGDFLQGIGRRASRVTLTGVITGEEAKTGLKTLRDKFRAAEPVSFVADIATATKVDQVIIAQMGVRELAGLPERFEYSIHLVEFVPPPATQAVTEQPPIQAVDEAVAADAAEVQETAVNQIDAQMGTIEVTVEPSEADADLSQLQIIIQGQTSEGQDYRVVLDQQTNGVFRKTDVPVGEYIVSLQVT
ncbi:MAG TPA: hypothetical protein DCP31_20750 [Cyanobacteria bacterium UBA8543]|nr:hypothetical protein [Cyanobacteria bacterium UBA8543]